LKDKEEKLKAWERELTARAGVSASVSSVVSSSVSSVGGVGGSISASTSTSSISTVSSTSSVASRNISAYQARRISMDRNTELMTIDEESDSTTTNTTTPTSTDDVVNHYFNLSAQPTVVPTYTAPYSYTSNTNVNKPPPYVTRQLPAAAPFTIYSDPVYTPNTNTTTSNTSNTCNDMPPPPAPRLYTRPVPRTGNFTNPTTHTPATNTNTNTSAGVVTGAEYSKENQFTFDMNVKARNKDAVYRKVSANVNQGIASLSAQVNVNAPPRRALGDLPVPVYDKYEKNSVMGELGSPLKKQRVPVSNGVGGVGSYGAVPTSTVQVDLQTLLRKR